MFGSFLQQNWMLMVCGFFAALTAGVAMMWSKYPIRWLLAIGTVALLVFVAIVPTPEIDPQLPAIFRDYFKVWFALLGLVAVYTLTHLGFLIFRHYFKKADAAAEGTYPDIDAAWQEIAIRLSQSGISIADQKLYFLLSPTEALARSVVDAAGLHSFATAPASPEAPIHCYALADALLFSIAGASSLGRQDAEGKARLEYLARLIASQTPERPTVRGIAVLLPFEWATSPEALRQVSTVREDLQTIASRLKVRCPTLAVFCLRESMPGFNEFAVRMPANLRQSRCGFTVPRSLGFSDQVLRRGMLWMIQWFESWTLNLMVQEIRNKDGNGRLVNMNGTLRTNRNNLINLLGTGLTMHQQAEPVMFRGCYFVACGPEPDKHAFAAGLLRGAKGRLIADHPLATWSEDAQRLDRITRQVALGLAIAAVLIASMIWAFGILGRLADEGASWVGYASIGGLAIAWAVVLLGPKFRKPAIANKAGAVAPQQG